MSKIDNIFKKVISDPEMRKQYDIDPKQYSNINQGMMSNNVFVKTVAILLSSIDKHVEADKTNMRIMNQSGPVILTESFKTSLYKKLVSTLQKELV